jgi:metal-sulfur cluster biosynthetic enzyme
MKSRKSSGIIAAESLDHARRDDPPWAAFRCVSRIPSMTEETTTQAPDHDDVMEALENVIDPELGLDFVSLGLVYDVEIEGPEVHITFTLTTPGCPIGPQVTEQMKEFVSEVEGVEKVFPKMVFQPPWSPERMSEDAKFALGF